MKKLKLTSTIWAVIAINLLFISNLFGQTGLTPPSIVIMDEDDGKNVENDLDERQNTTMTYDVRVANLVPLAQAQYGITYFLSEDYPRMALRYEIGNNTGVVDIEEFSFEKAENGHALFIASGEINLSFSTECKAGNGEPITIQVTGYYSLVINDDDDVNSYPIQPYSGFEDIFSCEVFAETCGFCFQECPTEPVTQLHFSMTHEYNCHEVNEDGDTGGEDGGGGVGGFNGGSSSAFNSSNQHHSNILISPNPAYHSIRIDYTGQENETGNIQIFDNTGKIMINQVLHSIKGFNTTQIDLSSIEQGIYFGQLKTGNEIIPFKVIKLK